MNQASANIRSLAQRKIPEEWTPQMWKAHVTEQEKRINELEREVYNLKENANTPTYEQARRLTMEQCSEPRNNAGVAWLR